jgi:hypothetical protein
LGFSFLLCLLDVGTLVVCKVIGRDSDAGSENPFGRVLGDGTHGAFS